MFAIGARVRIVKGSRNMPKRYIGIEGIVCRLSFPGEPTYKVDTVDGKISFYGDEMVDISEPVPPFTEDSEFKPCRVCECLTSNTTKAQCGHEFPHCCECKVGDASWYTCKPCFVAGKRP